MRKLTLVSILSAFAVASFGCGGPDPIVLPDAAVGDAGRDAGPFNDQNNSIAEAVALVSDTAVMAGLETAADHDYYSFTANAGEWVLIFTVANADDDPTKVDTVITLRDSGGAVLAENDDAVPRQDPDSEIIYRIPTSGTYYVDVEEFSTWQDETPVFGPTFTYAIEMLLQANVNPDYATFHAETGTDPTPLAAVAGTSADFGLIAGHFDNATDEDVFSFTTTANRQATRFTVMPRGTAEGYGSTALPARLWVEDEAGAIMASLTPATFEVLEDELMDFLPSLPAGNYFLHIERDGTAGANDFYVVKWSRAIENDPENPATEAANGDPTMPNPITLETDEEDATLRRGFVLATLPVGDTDHFSVTTIAGEQINVFCSSGASGMGVDGLRVRVLESATPFTELATATETATDSAGIEEETVPVGTYLIELTRAGTQRQSGGVDITTNFVRCGVALAPPPPPEP